MFESPPKPHQHTYQYDFGRHDHRALSLGVFRMFNNQEERISTVVLRLFDLILQKGSPHILSQLVLNFFSASDAHFIEHREQRISLSDFF